jgi:hypothetical protein
MHLNVEAAGNCTEGLRASSREEDQRVTQIHDNQFCFMADGGTVDTMFILILRHVQDKVLEGNDK